MTLRPMTPERFAAIRKGVMERRAKALVAEIAEIDWSKLRHFDVDDFLSMPTPSSNRPRPREHDPRSVPEARRHSVMHLLLIASYFPRLADFLVDVFPCSSG
jgi:hypothetical protein